MMEKFHSRRKKVRQKGLNANINNRTLLKDKKKKQKTLNNSEYTTNATLNNQLQSKEELSLQQGGELILIPKVE